MIKGVYSENLKIALGAIRAQLLRTILTGLIISIGITALVGILTAIDAIKVSITGQFSRMGANTFTIRYRGPNIQVGKNGKTTKVNQTITFQQALEFKEKYDQKDALVSVSYIASGTAQVSYESYKTDPNVAVWAADENYVETGGYQIDKGRDISQTDVKTAAPIALIGKEVKGKLFPKKNPLGEFIEIGGRRYRVVGIMKEKGNAMGFGGDKSVFIPISKARSSFSQPNQSYAINIMSLNPEALETAISEATSLMRKVRRLNPKEKDNFGITRSDNLSKQLIESLSYITFAAIIIALITLLGAAIALMNIMLVSVTERTREIGIRKAIGAKAKTIRMQFLTEAIVICFLGGFAGIILGLTIGNLTSMIIGGSFIVPWNWMALALVLCFVVGLISGIYPAYKASNLDPIDSLRYE